MKMKMSDIESRHESEDEYNNLPQGSENGLEKVNNWFKNQTEDQEVPDYEYQITTKRDPVEILLNRQSIRDLPLFSGEPEDWPLFISQFRKSTGACKFTDEENLIRIQKCLRGRARETVKPLLISSSNLETVLETLEMTFGRPEIIISMLIEKAKKTPSPREGKPDSILLFSNAVTNLITTMEVLNSTGHMYNPQLLDEITRKLPYFLKLNWGEYALKHKSNVDLKMFSEWLREKAKISCYVDNPVFRTDEKNTFTNRRETVLSIGKEKKLNERRCVVCKEMMHSLEYCKTFKDMNVDERWGIVVKNKLCICCLKSNHFKADCRKKKYCGSDRCTRIHHPLLHKPSNIAEPVQHVSEAVQELPSRLEQVEHINLTKKQNEVLLKILPVTVKGPNGVFSTYAFFDEGATISLIDLNLANDLGLEGIAEPICYQWTNGIIHQEDNSKIVDFVISGSTDEKYFKLNQVRTIKNLMLPTQTLDADNVRSKYPNVEQLKNISSYHEKTPQILVGQDHGHLIATRRMIQLDQIGPILSKTLLGWVLHGNLPELCKRTNNRFLFHICNKLEYEELHEMVKNSFTTESFGVKIIEKYTKTKEDERCEALMQQTTSKIGDKFETGLLWRRDETKFPDNKKSALIRLYCMERKMDKDEKFAEQYCQKINEYVEKGYARKLDNNEINDTTQNIWYLPHFGVVNANKPGKLRLVFDAAAKTQEISLNSELLSGPDLLKPLTGVLMKFRQNQIAYAGDIKEMFHQVHIRKEDRRAQRFLWRGSDRNIEPETYEMIAMTFGATCSPCLAQYIKNRNAKDNETEFPEASKAIIEKHYVDDYLDSSISEYEAINQIQKVIEVHRRGGFEICNFISNSKAVLRSIPENLRSNSSKNIEEFSQNRTEKILGLRWLPERDEFIFSTNLHKINPDILNGKKVPTKREILKFLMSIFDPLGFLCSVMITLKILLQEIWKVKIGWDDELPTSFNDCWSKWINQLQEVIPLIKIPRCYGRFSNLSESQYTELHVFCDASEKAFATVIYIRFRKETHFEISLVSAKTRVCPLKQTSIPRLELQAALMGSRLMKTIMMELEVNIDRVYMWTDFMTVLRWIATENVRYKTFIAHRIGEILELTDRNDWYWIPTKENVADEATRPFKDQLFSRRWFTGPAFLLQPNSEWNFECHEKYAEITEEILEIKKSPILSLNIVKNSTSLPDTSRFSSYEKLLRTTAWVLRFIANCKTRKKNYEQLSVDEIKNAEKLWYREVQKRIYAEELKNLENGKDIEKSSKIYKLSPILQDGIICMKGRINSQCDKININRNPIILGVKHPFTQLLIRGYHVRANHNGYEFVINEMRQKFWIPKLRNAVKQIWNRCQFCKNRRVKPKEPEMGYLPEARLAVFQKPFTKTGVDYFGPFFVTVGRRHEKRWGVIFTCMTTRAVHIEMSWTLDTASMIMALKRLIGRRGTVTDLYSDNGTNFRSANRELFEKVQQLDKKELTDRMVAKRITWHFNPPAASHMGGSWERLIRSIRRSLDVILKEKYPKEEVLMTTFVEIEGVLNSRPLTYVSVDPESPESLTPNHFLIGSSNGQPLGASENADLDLKRQWKVVQALSDQFWKRWLKEYLPELNQRKKWHEKKVSLKEDDIVVIADNNLPRNTWPLGRITRIYPGKDGTVRVVEVKTQNGVYKRPVVKICKLETEE